MFSPFFHIVFYIRINNTHPQNVDFKQPWEGSHLITLYKLCLWNANPPSPAIFSKTVTLTFDPGWWPWTCTNRKVLSKGIHMWNIKALPLTNQKIRPMLQVFFQKQTDRPNTPSLSMWSKCWLPALASFVQWFCQPKFILILCYFLQWSLPIQMGQALGKGSLMHLLDILYRVGHCLTFSQTTNFRLFHTERVRRRQFQIWWKWQKVFQMGRKHCGLVWERVTLYHTIWT